MMLKRIIIIALIICGVQLCAMDPAACSTLDAAEILCNLAERPVARAQNEYVSAQGTHYLIEHDEERMQFKAYKLSGERYELGYVTYSLYEHDGYINVLFVLPRYHNEGIGSRLLEHAIEYCRQQGVVQIILMPIPLVDDEDDVETVQAAQQRLYQFYQRRGFEWISDCKMALRL